MTVHLRPTHLACTVLRWLLTAACLLFAGLALHLDSISRSHPETLAKGPTFIGHNIVHPTAKIGSDCAIGPDVSIGIECEIGNGVRISNSVLLHRVKVGWVSRPQCVRLTSRKPGLINQRSMLRRWLSSRGWPCSNSYSVLLHKVEDLRLGTGLLQYVHLSLGLLACMKALKH